MSLLFCDGFNHSSKANLDTANSVSGLPYRWSDNDISGVLELTAGTHADNYMTQTSTSVSRNVRLTTLQNHKVGAWGMACFIGAYPSGDTAFLAFSDQADSGADQIYLYITSAGAIKAFRGTAAGTLLATSADGVIPVQTEFHIEAYVDIDPSAGVVQVWVNGTLVINLSGANTRNTANSSFDRVRVNLNSEFSVTDNFMYFGAPYLATARLGVAKIVRMYPTVDDSVQWTPASGMDNYAMVDEQYSDGGTTEVSVDGNGQQGYKDLYGLTLAEGFTPETIYGINVGVFARRANVNNRIRIVIASNAVQAESGDINPSSTSHKKTSHAFSVDPFSEEAFTVSDIENLSFGFVAQVVDSLTLGVTMCYVEALVSVQEAESNARIIPAGTGSGFISDGLSWRRLGAAPE